MRCLRTLCLWCSLGFLLLGPALAFPAQAPEDIEATVYFDYGQNDLGSAGRLLVTEIARKALSLGMSDVLIVGHTDTLGPASDNLRTGQERADAVADLLVTLGFDEASIQAESAGETDPAFRYDDDRRDPRNRRAVVTFRS